MSGAIRRAAAAAILMGAAASGCGGPLWGGAAGHSLYSRLGGEERIKAIVHDFVGRAANNPTANFARKGTSVE